MSRADIEKLRAEYHNLDIPHGMAWTMSVQLAIGFAESAYESGDTADIVEADWLVAAALGAAAADTETQREMADLMEQLRVAEEKLR